METEEYLRRPGVIFTGTFDVDRETLKAEAEQNDWRASETFNAFTRILVVGATPGAHKLKEAEVRGIQTVDVVTWREACLEASPYDSDQHLTGREYYVRLGAALLRCLAAADEATEHHAMLILDKYVREMLGRWRQRPGQDEIDAISRLISRRPPNEPELDADINYARQEAKWKKQLLFQAIDEMVALEDTGRSTRGDLGNYLKAELTQPFIAPAFKPFRLHNGTIVS